MIKFKFSHFYKTYWVFNYKNFQLICFDLLEYSVEDIMDYRDILFNFGRVEVYKGDKLKKTIYTDLDLEIPPNNN